MAFFFFLLFAPGARAADFEPNTAVWGAATYRSVAEDPLNTGNQLAQIPRETEQLELRPDWRVKGNGWKLTARPRLFAVRETTKTSSATTSKTLLLSRWSEGYASYTISDAFSLDYGLQNFQWGPAESASPSNRIFRDTVQAKDSLYLVRGEHLVRVSFAPSASWSTIFLFEPTSNGDAEPEANEPHSLKGALKSEYSWSGGANFAGVVLGWRDRSGFWEGAYMNLELVSGLFAYTDAAVESGSRAWYPVRDARSGVVLYSQNHSSTADSFLVGGLRYAFENGNDWRVEEIHQSAGYSSQELGLSSSALASRSPLQLASLSNQAPAARASGTDFPARDYLFSSVRFPNAWGFRDFNIYVRGLYSLTDHSSSGFLSSENRLGDHGTVIGGISATRGRDTGELRGVVDFAGTAAYRHAW